MKKTTKAMMIIALCCALCGASFCIVSFCFGFSMGDFRMAVKNGRFELIGPSGWQENVGEWVTDFSEEKMDYEQNFTGIRSLSVDAGVADCTFVLWKEKEWKVMGSNLPSGFRCRQSGGKLQIVCKNRVWKFWDRKTGTKLTVYIPEEAVLDEALIDAGVGDVFTQNGFLKCDKLDVDCSVGSCSLNADVRKKVKLNGGVGDIQITLLGTEQSFDYDIDLGVGSLTVGDTMLEGIGKKQKTDNGAKKELRASCGVGDIKISFQEEQ